MAKRAKIFVTILCVNKPPLYVTVPPGPLTELVLGATKWPPAKLVLPY